MTFFNISKKGALSNTTFFKTKLSFQEKTSPFGINTATFLFRCATLSKLSKKVISILSTVCPFCLCSMIAILLSKKTLSFQSAFSKKVFYLFCRSRAWSTAISFLSGTCWYEHTCKTSKKRLAKRCMKIIDAKSYPRWSAKTLIR